MERKAVFRLPTKKWKHGFIDCKRNEYKKSRGKNANSNRNEGFKMKDKFIRHEVYTIYDSKVNHIRDIPEEEMSRYKFFSDGTGRLLTKTKYNFQTMEIGDYKEFLNVSRYYRSIVMQAARYWIEQNKLNWKFTACRKLDKIYLTRIK